MQRRSLIFASLAALGLAAVAAWSYLGDTSPASQPRLPVVRVAFGTVSDTVLASGMLEARRLVSVGARVSGQIKTLQARLGDQVQAGDLLAQIDSRDQENDVLQAEAAVAQIRAQITAKTSALHRATLSLTRQATLEKRSLTTSEQLESAEADVLMLEADLEALRAQLASSEVNLSSAKVALERTRITSPIAGTVVAVVVKEGQMLNAAQQAPTIVKIADLSTMIVKAEVSEADVMKVEPGQAASFTTLGAPGQPFEAVVRGIEPAPAAIETSDTIASDAAVYYNALLEVDNADGRLRIGMSAEVSIQRAKAEGLLVPASAVKSDAQGSYVEIATAGTAVQRRAVVPGLTDKVMTEIREGLAEGDVVITGSTGAGGAGSQARGRGMPPRGLF